MTKKQFDTMNFHKGMKYAYTDIITKGIETLNLKENEKIEPLSVKVIKIEESK